MAAVQTPPVCWVVTDGRAGIEAQALGLAEAIARRAPLEIVVKRVRVRSPFRTLPREVWRDPFTNLESDSDPVGAPWPALWIGCGRLSVPFSMAVKRRSPQTFVVQIQNPRAPLSAFDLVIPPEHDAIRGENVFAILGSPNRIDAATLRRPVVAGFAPVAVLVGGENKAFRFGNDDAAALAEKLVALQMPLDVTVSRRTPRSAADILRSGLGDFAARFFDPARSDDENPYPAMLASARAILVTEDSVNMAAEAASTGKPVYVLRLRRKPFARTRKFDAFHEGLRARNASRPFEGVIESWRYDPLDETARAAEAALSLWNARWR